MRDNNEIRRNGYMIKRGESGDVVTLQEMTMSDIAKFKVDVLNKYRSLDCRFSAIDAKIKGILEYLRSKDRVVMTSNVIISETEIPKKEGEQV